ncbi:Eco57I restriction-modification methylase domain-containing protein [Bacteroidota bacterium]
MEHLNQIFDKLGLSRDNGLFIRSEGLWKGMFSNRVERLLNQVIQPDAFFCIDNKPLLLFFESPDDKHKKLKQIWNFNESPIVIVAEADSVEIFNGYEYLLQKESLKLLGTQEKLGDFHYFHLVTGKSWEQYQDEFKYDSRIDYHLLENIKATRLALIEREGLSESLANAILGKVIFVQYLIDRRVKLDFEQRGETRVWTNEEFCTLLLTGTGIREFFEYLTNKFGEDLFPIDEEDFVTLSSKCFQVIFDLLTGKEIATGQLSLFGLYDFSIIPVEFISNVYELFIGQGEQEKKGAYYTPLFLVDYVLSETVEKLIREPIGMGNCRILDPACGSGIFLVESLRKIIENFRNANPNFEADSEEYGQALRDLTVENIYGVDRDESAINVAVFSIYLTLLDYQDPSDIESFTFPSLLDTNFFVADFFDSEASFNRILSQLEFNFILGNPPWRRGKGEEGNPLFVQYIRNRKRRERAEARIEIEISNNEIAQAFVYRVSDFATTSTQIGLIVTSKMLYNLNAKGFRKYLLDRFAIRKVLELAPVRREVFDKSNDSAIAPAAVLFYQKSFSQITDDNIIEHVSIKPSRFFSLFKILAIQRGDHKGVVQNKFKQFDFLWKILVYGNYLDFNMVLRLKEEYDTVLDVISDRGNYVYGQGIQVGGGDQNEVNRHLGKNYVNARRDIKAFWVNPEPRGTWSHSIVHRPRIDEIFNGPMILIAKGFTTSYRCVAAYTEQSGMFTDAITSINIVGGESRSALKNILGVLNSSLYAYLNLLTFSSSGIEREQAHNREKFGVPYTDNLGVSSVVDDLTSLFKIEYGTNVQTDIYLQEKISKKISNLDSQVAEAFSISELELNLIDYAVNETIPLITKSQEERELCCPLPFESEILKEYVHLFLERFNQVYESRGKKLTVEISHTNQVVGLFFKLGGREESKEYVRWRKSDNDGIIQILASIGVQKITNRLFVLKDVRGFEADGFYLVKPNEKRLWHKAVGFLDLNEFVDAVLKAGKQQGF